MSFPHKEEWNNTTVLTRKGVHTMLKLLDNELEGTPSAIWMRDWIDCLSYFCSCVSCRRRMKKSNLDVRMMDEIFAPIMDVGDV